MILVSIAKLKTTQNSFWIVVYCPLSAQTEWINTIWTAFVPRMEQKNIIQNNSKTRVNGRSFWARWKHTHSQSKAFQDTINAPQNEIPWNISILLVRNHVTNIDFMLYNWHHVNACIQLGSYFRLVSFNCFSINYV